MTAAKNSAQLSVVSDQSKVTDVREIEIELLVVSVAETRKTIDQKSLNDLAASIAQHGIQEPLLVRPYGAPKGSPIASQLDRIRQHYEIISGQRRYLAAQIAGKMTCPSIVREMSDEEAAELRIISNLQREDLEPLEEALAFKAQLSVPGATVETVAAKLAKSPSHIGRRLKLLDAIEPVREALKAGAIEVGHAMELARLDEKQQIRHLSRLNCGYVANAAAVNQFARDDDGEFDDNDDAFDDGGDDGDSDGEAARTANASESRWKPTDASVSELKREIAHTTLMVLASAPFPLDDELPPMACTECPKRSGNAALLFDDCAQDTCTDRDCFDTKVRVWVKYELERADKEKRKLVMLAGDYSGNKLHVWKHDVTITTDQGGCDGEEEAIWINGEKAGHRATICRDPKCKKHKGRNGRLPSGTDPVKAAADRKKLLAKVREEKEYRARLFRAIAAVKVSSLSPVALTALVRYAIGRSDGTLRGKAVELLGWDGKLFEGYGEKREKALGDHLAALPEGDAVRAALLFSESRELAVHEYASEAKPEGLEALAKMFGVDLKAVRAGFVDGRPMPIEPAIAKKTPILAADARKRIADAVKKRWADQRKPAKAAKPKPAEKAVKAPAKKTAKATVKKVAKKAVKR